MNATYNKGYKAHTTTGSTVTLPDEVVANQREFDRQEFRVLDRTGVELTAVLRGDLHGLGTPGTGDPVVEIVED